MPSQKTIDEYHRHLLEFFGRLREDRNKPVFLLEYLGAGVNTKELSGCVARALAAHPCTDLGWRRHYLPLLAVAADHGYTYRGPSTKFWEGFESRLGIKFDLGARRALSDLHKLAVTEIQAAEPMDTPWTRQFCHIAWPITHAILPLDLQLDLTSCLARSRTAIHSESDPGSLIAALRSESYRNTGVRFQRWLESPDIVHAVVLGLLQRTEESWLNRALLQRLHKDIESDHSANVQLKVAQRKQEQLRTIARPAHKSVLVSIVHGEVYLSLDSKGQAKALGVRFPALSTQDTQRARTCRIQTRLWGQGTQFRIDTLFSGQIIPFSIESWPQGSKPICDIGQEAGRHNPLVDRLSQSEVDIRLPLMFHIPRSAEVSGDFTDDEGGFWPHVTSRAIDEATRTFLLTDTCPPEGLDGIEDAGDIAGVQCLEVDTRMPEALSWLRGLGLSVGSPTGIRWVGAPGIESSQNTFVHVDDPVVTRILGEGILTDKESECGIEVSCRDLVEVTAKSANLVLNLATDVTTVETRLHRRDNAPLCRIHGEPLGPLSIQSLLNGTLTMRIQGALPLEDLCIRTTLEADDLPLTWMETQVAGLPTIVGGRHWADSLSPDTFAQVSDLDDLLIRVEIPGLWGCTWNLPGDDLEYSWQDTENQPQAISESGSLPLVCASSEDPIQFLEKAPAAGEPICLWMPSGKDHLHGGICTGSRSIDAMSPQPDPPHLIRRSHGTGGTTAGLMDVLRAYFKWSTASSSNQAVEIRRRQVARNLESWAVQIMCGKNWTQEEHQTAADRPADAWDALIQVCAKTIHEDETIGFDAWVHEEEGLSDQELVALQRFVRSRLNATIPDLSNRLWLGCSPDEIPLDALHRAFNGAYSDLHAELSLSQPESIAGRELKADSYVDDTTWVRMFDKARRSFQFQHLVHMLWPRGDAGELAEYDYEGSDPGDLAAVVADWATRHGDALLRTTWEPTEVHTALQIWLSPRSILQSDWQTVATRLLEDRGASRAFRYVAVRYNSARAFTTQEKVHNA